MTTWPAWLQVVAALALTLFGVSIAGAVRDEIHDARWRKEERAKRAELVALEAVLALPSADPRIHVCCPECGEICVCANPTTAAGEWSVHLLTCHGGLL
jgi:hypothetical protein